MLQLNAFQHLSETEILNSSVWMMIICVLYSFNNYQKYIPEYSNEQHLIPLVPERYPMDGLILNWD